MLLLELNVLVCQLAVARTVSLHGIIAGSQTVLFMGAIVWDGAVLVWHSWCRV